MQLLVSTCIALWSTTGLHRLIQKAVLSSKQVDQAQFDKIMEYISIGKEEGAKLMTGGNRYGSKGMFVEPTIFAEVKVQ